LPVTAGLASRGVDVCTGDSVDAGSDAATDDGSGRGSVLAESPSDEHAATNTALAATPIAIVRIHLY
jgi:hypothetical protein